MAVGGLINVFESGEYQQGMLALLKGPNGQNAGLVAGAYGPTDYTLPEDPTRVEAPTYGAKNQRRPRKPTTAFALYLILALSPSGVLTLCQLQGLVVEWCPRLAKQQDSTDPGQTFRLTLSKWKVLFQSLGSAEWRIRPTRGREQMSPPAATSPPPPRANARAPAQIPAVPSSHAPTGRKRGMRDEPAVKTTAKRRKSHALEVSSEVSVASSTEWEGVLVETGEMCDTPSTESEDDFVWTPELREGAEVVISFARRAARDEDLEASRLLLEFSREARHF